jgi:hypothetical protein
MFSGHCPLPECPQCFGGLLYPSSKKGEMYLLCRTRQTKPVLTAQRQCDEGNYIINQCCGTQGNNLNTIMLSASQQRSINAVGMTRSNIIHRTYSILTGSLCCHIHTAHVAVLTLKYRPILGCDCPISYYRTDIQSPLIAHITAIRLLEILYSRYLETVS